MSDTPEIDGLLDRKLKNLEAFKKNQEGLWQTINLGYLGSGSLIDLAVRSEPPQLSGVAPGLLWQQCLDYQMNALFLIIGRSLDEGMALLRLAADLAKDLARLSEKPSLKNVWLSRLEGKNGKNAYKKHFIFDNANPPKDADEAMVKKLWMLTSSFAVHGHIVKSMALTEVERDRDVVYLQVSDIEVMKSLTIWMTGFLPVHSLCMKPFLPFNTQAGEYFVGSYSLMHKEFSKITSLLIKAVGVDAR